MHDIRLIRENPAAFDEGMRKRGLDALSAHLLSLDDARKMAIAAAQDAQERRNALSREIGAAKKAKDEARAAALMAEVASLKEGAPALEAAEKAASEALRTELAGIPNVPGEDVPEGEDEHGNVERTDHAFAGSRPRLNSAKQHFELGEAWRVANGTAMDFEAAAKLSGSRFVVLRGQLARLERALGQFMIDLHTGEHGYTEVAPPLLVRDDVMFGTAQLPKFEDDQFAAYREPTLDEDYARLAAEWRKHRLGNAATATAIAGRYEPLPPATSILLSSSEQHPNAPHAEVLGGAEPRSTQNGGASFEADLRSAPQDEEAWWQASTRRTGRFLLIPTAEVPLTNLVRESILSEEELPLRFAALTPCFRAEAGAAGRDTRGMLRQHQFSKCELVSITTPEASAEEHERMLACAEAVLRKLDLPHRVMTLCTGDMGFAARKTYDIEVWVPGQGTYREISSCSVCGDFQARRMEARYRPKEGKGPRYVHTLNGSGVAVGRALIAVMENYQQPDGTVEVPEVLRPYMGGLTRIGG